VVRKVERCLRNFVAFLQVEGASYITTQLALRWTIQFAKVQPSTRAERLGMVRRFATWHSATEPRTEIPPAELLPHRYRRKPPHIYSDEEIERLFAQAQQLPSPKGLRARTITTLFGLLAVPGMRVSEALGLDRPDVDLDRGILHIRRGKWGKSRYVPVHPSTVVALKKCAEARDRLFPASPTPAFFLSERGCRITGGTAQYSGGFRYMYYYIERDGQIFLLMVFNKNEQDNLTEKQKETLSSLIRELREEGRRTTTYSTR
jgi:integrase/recombinase XerD